MSQGLRKLTGVVSKSKTCLFFINQIRIDPMKMFGSKEVNPGGNALKFYSSVRLDIRKIESLKKGDEIIGNRVRVKVIKNKCASPHRQAEFDIIFGHGISVEGEIIDLGIKHGIIEKSGVWLSYNGERLGQGRENAKVKLIEFPEIKDIILKDIKEKITITLDKSKDSASIEEALIFLYDLRHDDGEVVDSIETVRIPWEGKEYSLRQLVHKIEKNDLKQKLDLAIKEKMELKEKSK